MELGCAVNTENRGKAKEMSMLQQGEVWPVRKSEPAVAVQQYERKDASL